MRDWFIRGFGNAIADIRREVVEISWSGRAESRPMGQDDRFFADKLYPDKIGERGFLGWLEATRPHDADREPQRPGHDHDIDR